MLPFLICSFILCFCILTTLLTPIPRRRHERTVSNLREALINGAVPDNPTRFVHRPTLTESLSGCLRDLASRFRVQSSQPKCATNICDIMASTNLEEPSLTSSVRNHPPPTNAWLLVHGPPGCGKTVLCTSTLRDHAFSVIQYFPGGEQCPIVLSLDLHCFS